MCRITPPGLRIIRGFGLSYFTHFFFFFFFFFCAKRNTALKMNETCFTLYLAFRLIPPEKLTDP